MLYTLAIGSQRVFAFGSLEVKILGPPVAYAARNAGKFGTTATLRGRVPFLASLMRPIFFASGSLYRLLHYGPAQIEFNVPGAQPSTWD